MHWITLLLAAAVSTGCDAPAAETSSRGAEDARLPAAPAPATSADPAGAGAADAALSDSARLTIRVLRVSARSGGGDAILVADSSAVPARHVLIDAGDDAQAARELERLGVDSLDLLVLTHAHFDHYGGMDDVLRRFPVRAFAFSGQIRTAVTYERLLRLVRDRVQTVVVVDTLRRVRLGGGAEPTTLTLLPPLRAYAARDSDDGEELNEASLAVRVERAGFAFLTTGDAEDEANRHFAGAFPALVDVEVLKVGHHGSADATQPAWLDAVSPEVAVVSANGTTHPYAEVLEAIRSRGIRLYCTPQHGIVTLRVSGAGSYEVSTGSDPSAPCRPGTERGGR